MGGTVRGTVLILCFFLVADQRHNFDDHVDQDDVKDFDVHVEEGRLYVDPEPEHHIGPTINFLAHLN